jgi:hypothetical protein
MIILGVVAAGALPGVVVVELSHYLAMGGVVASSRAGRGAQGRTSEAVIVLGFPPRRDGRTNAVQRWRCRIAVRSLDAGQDPQLGERPLTSLGLGTEGACLVRAAAQPLSQCLIGVP